MRAFRERDGLGPVGVLLNAPVVEREMAVHIDAHTVVGVDVQVVGATIGLDLALKDG